MNRLAFTLNDYPGPLGEAEKALAEAAMAGEVVVDGEVETVIDVNGSSRQQTRANSSQEWQTELYLALLCNKVDLSDQYINSSATKGDKK